MTEKKPSHETAMTPRTKLDELRARYAQSPRGKAAAEGAKTPAKPKKRAPKRPRGG